MFATSHFTMDLNSTFTEASSSSAMAQIVCVWVYDMVCWKCPLCRMFPFAFQKLSRTSLMTMVWTV
jgi:hypothetical protein